LARSVLAGLVTARFESSTRPSVNAAPDLGRGAGRVDAETLGKAAGRSFV
jgi:hypothetical protein